MKKGSSTTKQAGYTLAEIVIVSALILVIASIFFTSISNFGSRQSLDSFTNDIRIGLTDARLDTIASQDASQYGMYVGTSSVAFFTGTSFSTSSVPDSEITFSGTVSATSTFADGNWYVYFERLTGKASATGTISIIDTATNASNTITVYSTGLIE